MAALDWATLSNGMNTSVCKQGVTAGVGVPNGGGTYVFAFNMIASATGVAGRSVGIANFAPTLLGAALSGAVIRATTASSGISPFLFSMLGNTDVNATNCYLLGISDAEPAHIELRKGLISVGLPDEVPLGVNTILRRSTAVIPGNTWTHLRLETIVNTNGDVVLNCFQSNLGAHAVTAPTWEAIPGMDQFIDDFAGINSGSVPYITGYHGFAVKGSAVGARAYFDHIVLARQT